MAVRIKSLLTHGPLAVPLVDGSVVRLSPGEASVELASVDADGATVAKLRDRGLIAVEDVAKPRSKGRSRSSAESTDSADTAEKD